VRRSDPVVSLGLHACPSVDVDFAAAPATPLGAAGSGARHLAAALRDVRLGAAAISAGILKGSLGEALAYARERHQGGRRIADWSEIRMMLADMAVQARVADLCLTQACAAVAARAPDADELAAAATLHIQQQACEVVNDGVQVLGGNGYMKDYGQEKRYRDARQAQALLGAAPLRKLELGRALIERT
jgi:alkylation response protein AidB-like acyl-CoA dehydrogenase